MLVSDYLFTGEILIKQGRPERARELCFSALERTEGLKNIHDQWSWANHILGLSYSSEHGTGEDSIALEYMVKALDFATQMPRNSNLRMSNALIGLGDINSIYPIDNPNLNLAIEQYERALGHARRLRDKGASFAKSQLQAGKSLPKSRPNCEGSGAL